MLSVQLLHGDSEKRKEDDVLDLDQRGWMILHRIVDEPAVTGKELEQEFCISRKQLGYSIDKINDYLKAIDYQEIERLRTGKFRISSDLVGQFGSRESQMDGGKRSYIYSDKERGYLILLMILSRSSELSTVHFTSALGISKNTLLQDLKKLPDVTAPFCVSVFYHRKDGYILEGEEWTKRELLVFIIRKILDMRSGSKVLMQLGQMEKGQLSRILEYIKQIEQDLKIQFTDKRLTELPYIISLVNKRIKGGHFLRTVPDELKYVWDTKEYKAILLLGKQLGIEEPLELKYLTSQIQISNMSLFERNSNEVEREMVTAAQLVIYNFQLICCVQMEETDQLLDALLQHLKPAYYRIRYGYHVETSIKDLILPKHNDLHEIVKKSVFPFEELIGQQLPEEELVYFTLLFGAWLKRVGLLEFVEEKKQAIVVCANGISVSSFLFITLQELFPEIEMAGYMSVREYEKNLEHLQEHNIIFTTQRLETDKQQFIVTPFLNDHSKQKFREKVLRELSGGYLNGVQLSALLEIIEQHTTVHEKEQLVKSLDRYINHNGKEERSTDHPYMQIYPTLQELLTQETMMIVDHTQDWKEVLHLAAEPLLKKGCIEERYLKRIIHLIEQDNPYIMVAKGVVIAHAGVNDGVRSLGMSLVKLPAPISISGYLEADVILLLGTPDTTIHLRALFGLIEMLENEEHLKQLHQATSIEALMEIIESDTKMRV